MTPQDVCDIISRITYKPGWTVLMGPDGERWFIQLDVSIESDATLDSHKRDGTRTPWKSAKRYLSPHMCRQEVVGLIFGLIKDAEMHEVHEWFRYRGASIFNPHLDPEVLVEVAKKKSSFNVRENAMSMVEPPKERWEYGYSLEPYGHPDPIGFFDGSEEKLNRFLDEKHQGKAMVYRKVAGAPVIS